MYSPSDFWHMGSGYGFLALEGFSHKLARAQYLVLLQRVFSPKAVRNLGFVVVRRDCCLVDCFQRIHKTDRHIDLLVVLLGPSAS